MRLRVEKLGFCYGARRALQDVSFRLEAGQLLSVLGPNGAGKSTLFRCILGIYKGFTGSVLLDGEDVRRLPERVLAGKIAYIPQFNRPSFGYTAFDMVLMGTAHRLGLTASPGRAEREKAWHALEGMGVGHLAERNFSQLSGGEQQLIRIARALAQEAKVLVMDEPTANLDYGNQLRLLQRVEALCGEGYSILISTHNPQHSLLYGDGFLALREGRVAAWGDCALLDEALIKGLYGVDVSFVEAEGKRLILPRPEGGTSPRLAGNASLEE